jgi:hypothetical protein
MADAAERKMPIAMAIKRGVGCERWSAAKEINNECTIRRGDLRHGLVRDHGVGSSNRSTEDRQGMRCRMTSEQGSKPSGWQDREGLRG